MYTEAQMDHIKTELAEMISFWRYDQGGADCQVKTDFFDTPTNQEAATFQTYNETETMPRCGSMADQECNFDFGSLKDWMPVPNNISA